MNERSRKGRPLVAAYYFPNYHADARNARIHGPGWSEWELIRRSEPRFPGHPQPLVPAWGYGDEADPAVMERKIGAALSHGIDCFLFDWYYYDDGPFLERCLEEGFLGARNVADIRFACMWANHDWGDIHPAKRGVPPHIHFPGRVTPETFEKMTDGVIERYFPHPSHLRVDGAPFFSIYELGTLVDSFGSIAATRKALDRFREKTVRAGFPGLHLNAIAMTCAVLKGEGGELSGYQAAETLGFDSAGNYVWAHFGGLENTTTTAYTAFGDNYFAHFAHVPSGYSLPVHPNVTMGWDVTPRNAPSDTWDPALGYPFMSVVEGNTPAAFEQALRRAQRQAADREGFSMVTLNAWNEWTEGSYLEPDTVRGLGYLEAVRNVFGPSPGRG